MCKPETWLSFSILLFVQHLYTMNLSWPSILLPKMSLNKVIPSTAILIFSLLDYCHSFLMGLPISRVTIFHSTHWTTARVCFLNNKFDLVTHTIKILQWLSATYSMKIHTPEHSLQRLALIWLLSLSLATQDYPPWTTRSSNLCSALSCCCGFAHAVPCLEQPFFLPPTNHLLTVQVPPVLGSSSFAPLFIFWITSSCTSL